MNYNRFKLPVVKDTNSSPLNNLNRRDTHGCGT